MKIKCNIAILTIALVCTAAVHAQEPTPAPTVVTTSSAVVVPGSTSSGISGAAGSARAIDLNNFGCHRAWTQSQAAGLWDGYCAEQYEASEGLFGGCGACGLKSLAAGRGHCGSGNCNSGGKFAWPGGACCNQCGDNSCGGCGGGAGLLAKLKSRPRVMPGCQSCGSANCDGACQAVNSACGGKDECDPCGKAGLFSNLTSRCNPFAGFGSCSNGCGGGHHCRCGSGVMDWLGSRRCWKPRYQGCGDCDSGCAGDGYQVGGSWAGDSLGSNCSRCRHGFDLFGKRKSCGNGCGQSAAAASSGCGCN